MKKLAILLLVLLLSGCTVVRIDTSDLNNIVDVVLSKDNTLFNHLETIRIYDVSNREIHEERFYSHNMPMFRNKIKIIKRINSKGCILKSNSFIFSFSNIKVINDKEYKINKNELWYLSKGTEILDDGDYLVINCKFFKI